MEFQSISAAEFGERLKQETKSTVIDVRTPGEYAGVHVKGAINLPIDGLTVDRIRSASNGASESVYVVCQSGGRSRRACQQFSAAGVPLINVEGGTQACIAAGLPVIRGKGVIGIDRQVRIAAGSLVLIGMAVGWWLHPIGYALSAFVGAGLVFAGVTDTCGMAMLLAAMPWNQTKTECAIKS